MQLSYSVTLSAGTTAKASDVESKFTSVANVINGNLATDNFTTLIGGLTWNITTTAQALTVSSSSTTNQASFTQTADLAAGNSIVKVIGSAAIQTGDSLVRLDAQGSTNTVPVLKSTNVGTGHNFDIQNAGILGSGKRAVSITSSAAQVNGDAALYAELSSASTTIPTAVIKNAGTNGALSSTNSGTGQAIILTQSGVQGSGNDANTIVVSNAGSAANALSIKNAGAGPSLIVADNSGNALWKLLNSGAVAFGGSQSQGWMSNIGLTYSAHTLSITGADGTALSATNPAYVTIPSVAGQQRSVRVTAGMSFQDATGASQITGNLFGVTTGVAWNTDMPFYLYAVYNSANTTVTFALSRNPCARTTPAANNAKAGGTGATLDTSFFFLDSALTLANVTSAVCMCIGSIRMQKATAADDWTVQTLSNADGIGQFHDQTPFTMPISQNGATAGKYFLANGGTAPTFSTNTHTYFVRRTGIIDSLIYFKDTTSGAGAAGTNLSLALPTTSKTGGGFAGMLSSTIGGRNNVTTGSLLCIPDNGTASMSFTPANNFSAFVLNAYYGADATFYLAGATMYKGFLES